MYSREIENNFYWNKRNNEESFEKVLVRFSKENIFKRKEMNEKKTIYWKINSDKFEITCAKQ